MAKIIKKILYSLGFIVAVIIILLAVFLYLLRFTTPYLQHHRATLDAWLTELVAKPVHIGSIAVGRVGVNPELKFHNVTILNKAGTKNIVQIGEMDVEINLLKSLYRWQLTPNLLVIAGAHLDLYAGKGSALHPDSMLPWLLAQKRIYLHNITVTWHPKNGKAVTGSNLRLLFVNDVFSHQIAVAGGFAKDNPNQFRVVLKVYGDILQYPNIAAKGFIELKNLDIKQLHQYLPAKYLPVTQGTVAIKAWLSKAENQQLPVIQSQFMVKNFVIPQAVNIKKLSGNILLQYEQNKWKLLGNYYDLQINFNKLFRHDLAMDQLQALVTWQKLATGWNIRAKGITAQNADLNLAGNLNLFLPNNNSSPIIDILAQCNVNNISHASWYYPAGILPAGLVKWLDSAITTGTAASGTLILRGPVNDFPFEHHTGRFIISTNLDNINLNYAPDWIPIEHIYGKMVFDDNSMRIDANGKILNMPLSNIQVKIADLAEPILKARGIAMGDNAKLLTLITKTPLQKAINVNLANLQATGPMSLLLKLTMPIWDVSGATKVNGTLIERNGTLQISNWKFALQNLAGKINFTASTLSATNLTASLFNEPIRINIKTLKDNVQLVMQGKAAIAVLQQQFPATIFKHLAGDFNYRAILNLYKAGSINDFNITSNLQGLSIKNLPSPFAKTSEEQRDFSLGGTFATKQPLQLKLKYANYLTAALKFDKPLIFAGGTVNVTTPDAVGKVTIPSGFPKQPLDAHFAKLHLPAGTGKTFTLTPAVIPPIHLLVDKFSYAKQQFGKVELAITSIANKVYINKLIVDNARFYITATGTWKQQASALTGNFQVHDLGALLKQWGLTKNLTGGEGGMTFSLHWLDSIFNPKLKTMSGKVSLHFTKGSIINLSKETEKKIGIGQALNVLSLQAIPQRLSSNLGGLTSKGFYFSKIIGDFKLITGNAYTKNAEFNGTVARIKLAGRIGLGAKDFNLMLIIMPNVTSSVPVVATVVGGPVVGAVALAADELFRYTVQPFIAAYKYRVTGSWQHPLIKKISK